MSRTKHLVTTPPLTSGNCGIIDACLVLRIKVDSRFWTDRLRHDHTCTPSCHRRHHCHQGSIQLRTRWHHTREFIESDSPSDEEQTTHSMAFKAVLLRRPLVDAVPSTSICIVPYPATCMKLFIPSPARWRRDLGIGGDGSAMIPAIGDCTWVPFSCFGCQTVTILKPLAKYCQCVADSAPILHSHTGCSGKTPGCECSLC